MKAIILIKFLETLCDKANTVDMMKSKILNLKQRSNKLVEYKGIGTYLLFDQRFSFLCNKKDAS